MQILKIDMTKPEPGAKPYSCGGRCSAGHSRQAAKPLRIIALSAHERSSSAAVPPLRIITLSAHKRSSSAAVSPPRIIALSAH
jgi:hypothetical protein